MSETREVPARGKRAGDAAVLLRDPGWARRTSMLRVLSRDQQYGTLRIDTDIEVSAPARCSIFLSQGGRG